MIATRQFLMVAAASVILGFSTGAQALDQAAAQKTKSGEVKNDAKKLTASGVVLDSTGKPLRGATVEYWCRDETLFPGHQLGLKSKFTTRKNGSFEFQTSHGQGFLLAHKKGLAPAWKQLNLSVFDPDAKSELVLSSLTTLEGILVDESDKPVAKAEVFVSAAMSGLANGDSHQKFSYIAGKPIHHFFSAKTDAAGHFNFKNFPTNATASFGVQVPGKALRGVLPRAYNSISLPYSAGQKDIKLVVEPAGNIEGKIVVEDKSLPLPAATLTLQCEGGGFFGAAEFEPVQSDAKGVFHINDVLAGSYQIYASFGTNDPPDWVAGTVPVSVVSGQTARNVNVKAVRGGFLEVLVLGKIDRKPLAEATVYVFKDDCNASATTGLNGIALLRLLSGNYHLSANYESSLVSQAATGSVEAGNTNRVEVEITPPQKIIGVVHQPDGQAAPGVVVKIIGSFGPDTTDVKTDANGKFELVWNHYQMGNNNNMTPCILVRDIEHNLAAVQDIDEETGPLDLKLQPGVMLIGRGESDGKAVTNLAAALIFQVGNSGIYLNGLSCGTNVPGHFEIPALPPGRKYGISVTAPGYGQKVINDVSASSEPGRMEIAPVELKIANLKIAGQVIDADEKPVQGCFINLYGEGQSSGNLLTDREGRFSFDHVCEGTVRLSANNNHSNGTVSAEGGDTNVVLQLGQNSNYSPDSKVHKLQGTVTDTDGKTAEGVLVSVFPSNNGSHWTKTRTNGTFNLTWSLERWQQESGAQLVARDIARNLACAQELSEEITNLDAKLEPALAFVGQVKKADGAPLAGAEINVQIKTGNSFSQLDEKRAETDAQGRYEIKCLPQDGHYWICASASGYGQHSQQVQNDSETNRMELSPLILKIADRILAGQVVDDNEKPLSGVNVYLNGGDQPSGQATTDSKGRFHFKVCEGHVSLSASSQSGYAQAKGEAGDTNLVITLSSRGASNVQPRPRAALKGRALPDLASVNLAGEFAPAGQPVLLCLFDAGQRPSRHVINQLNDQFAALRQKGITVLAVQAVVTSDEIFNEWKTASPSLFPVGRVTDKSEKSKWASSAPSLPSLILTDAKHLVIAEGFAFDELDAQLKKLVK